MKKSALLLIGILCFIQTADAAQYYCSKSSGYNMNYLYDTAQSPEQSCGWLNKEFYLKRNPDAYKNCVARVNNNKQLYAQGQCIPVKTETKNINGSVCKISYIIKNSEKIKIDETCTYN